MDGKVFDMSFRFAQPTHAEYGSPGQDSTHLACVTKRYLGFLEVNCACHTLTPASYFISSRGLACQIGIKGCSFLRLLKHQPRAARSYAVSQPVRNPTSPSVTIERQLIARNTMYWPRDLIGGCTSIKVTAFASLSQWY